MCIIKLLRFIYQVVQEIMVKTKQEIEEKIKELDVERLSYIEERDKAKFCSIEAEVSHNLVVIKAMQMQILEWCLK